MAQRVDKGETLKDAIRAEAERLGFVACGFARAESADVAGAELKRWLEAGHHGTMAWMEERAHHRERCGASARFFSKSARTSVACSTQSSRNAACSLPPLHAALRRQRDFKETQLAIGLL